MQRDVEIEMGRFSESFGSELLSGMHSIPIGVVPKPRSSKLHLIVDHSANDYSPNSMIPKWEGYVHLDTLSTLDGHSYMPIEHMVQTLNWWYSSPMSHKLIDGYPCTSFGRYARSLLSMERTTSIIATILVTVLLVISGACFFVLYFRSQHS